MGVPKNAFGSPQVCLEPRTGRELIVSTHDFCDATTWYCTSQRATDQALTSVDGLVWSSPHPRWIDLTHGKVWDEDAICLDVAHGYSVEVSSGGVLKTPRAPFACAGGDYVVDYEAGTVTFSAPQEGVQATYSYAVDSTFVLAPDAGTRINIECAEVQFSADVVMNDSIDFEVWAFNPYDYPNKFRAKKTTYKRMVNFFDEAVAAFPVNPALGGVARGTQHASICLQFRYGTSRPLAASQGVEVRIRLREDQVFSGEHAIAALYCTVQEE